MQILADSWLVALFFFGFGLLVGWLIWAREIFKAQAEDDAPATGDLHAGAAKDIDPSDKLGLLEAELKEARALLEETESESEAFASLISGVEEAVKRANGRMKLLLKSIKRAKKDD